MVLEVILSQCYWLITLYIDSPDAEPEVDESIQEEQKEQQEIEKIAIEESSVKVSGVSEVSEEPKPEPSSDAADAPSEPSEAAKKPDTNEDSKPAEQKVDISKEADSSKPADENVAKEVVVEDIKENKSESEYEDIEDPNFDVFQSDDSTERRRIVQVTYKQGALGFIRKENMARKITIYVKTFYGDRAKEKFEIEINAEVGSLVTRMANKEEVNSYHIIKFMYPMGRMRSLSLTESFAAQYIPNNACLVLIGKKDFCWDFNRKGRNITVSIPSYNTLYSCITTN